MHRVLEYASNIFEGENLTQSQFYQWHRGERKKMLPKGFTLLIEEMHDKYIVRQQRYATGQRMSKVFFDEIHSKAIRNKFYRYFRISIGARKK